MLRENEQILYVNTLVNESMLEQFKGKRFEHGARRGRNHFVTYCFGEIMDRLTFLRHTAEEKNIKHLIVTGFELATLTTRHRAAFMGWLRNMRNSGINVILFTVSMPGKYGALGALRYSARSVEEVGAYLKRSANEQFEDLEIEVEQVEDVRVDVKGVVGRILMEEPINEYSDEAEAVKLYAEVPQHSDSGSLRIKELAVEFV